MQLSCKHRSGTRGTFLILGRIFGNFVQFCHFLFFGGFFTTNVVEQREILKTNLAGVKPLKNKFQAISG